MFLSRLVLTVALAILLAGPACEGSAADQEAVGQANRLTKAQVDKLKSGMTLVEVMAVLGSRAEINPDPPPIASGANEVVVVWREGREKWVGVVFVPGKDRVLRVLNNGETWLDYRGL